MGSPDALYQAVKTGRVKLDDLNDDGKAALRGYMQQNFPDLMGPSYAQEQQDAIQRFVAAPSVNVDDSPLMKKIQQTQPVQGPPYVSQQDRLDQKYPIDYPGGVLNPVNDINRLQRSKVGQFLNVFDRAVGQVLGVPDNMMEAPQTTGSKIADKAAALAGGLAGYAVNPSQLEQNVGQTFFENPLVNRAATAAGNAAQNGLGRVAPQALANIAGRATQSAVQGGLGAAAYAPFQTLISGGNLQDIPRNVLEQAAGGALIGGGLGGLGAGIGEAGQSVRNAFAGSMEKDALENMIRNTDMPVNPPSERLIAESPVPLPVNNGKVLADNFNQINQYQKEYQQAIQDQYDYLKNSLQDRGGVDQGGVIKDPMTGEVIDRYGRISNNPAWYQDFYQTNGRSPTDQDLRDLAKQHVDTGFQTGFGNMPAFKPSDISEIDQQLQDIQTAIAHADPSSRAALQQTANVLQQERGRLAKLIPDNMPAAQAAPTLESPVRPSPPAISAAAPKADPEALDAMVHNAGHNDVTPETIAQTFNNKTWYHGTGTDNLKADQLDPFVGNHESLFGQGIYLTDNPDIANGYAKARSKRTNTPTVYQAGVNVNRVLDLEKPVTPDVVQVLDKTVKPLDYQYNYHFEEPNHFTDLLNKWVKEGHTPEQIITSLRNEIRDFSHEAEIPTSEFVETFQDLATYLKESGYDGITHTGGKRTGHDAHRVLIMLDPQGKKWSGDVHPNQITRFEKYAPEASNLVPDTVQAMRTKEAAPVAEKQRTALRTSPAKNPRTLDSALNTRDQAVQAYAGNRIPFREPTTPTNKRISRNTVVNNLRKNLGVVIDSGRLNAGRGVLGLYKVNPEVVRSGMAEDLQVISHEVGHHLDKKFGLQNPAYMSEFMKVLKTNPVIDLSAYSPEQIPGEGVAEYVRLRLTDPEKARQLAPNFTRYFDQKLPPKMLKGLEASQQDINTWLSQGAYEQAKGLLDFTSGEKAKRFSPSKWYTQFVDDLNPLKLLEKSLKGKIGIGGDSIYKMARLSRGISARAELAVTHGIYDAAGRKMSDGLAEIVRPLAEIGMKEKDFATYLAVKHAQDLKVELGKRVPFDDAQMKAVLDKWDHNPVVQEAQRKIVQFNHALTDILVDAQVLDPVTVMQMRRKYPNYVPFMRYFDDDAVAGFKNGGFGAAKGFANIANPVKRMTQEGSTRTIINPIESMVKNAFLVMNAAAKNKVGLQLAELSKVEGAGAWVEHVGEGGSSPHEHVVSVYQNGVRQSYKVRNPDLYNAMLSLDNESSGSLMRFLSGAASSLRAGATLTPDFMVRNVLRDVIGNTVNATKYGFNPLTLFKGLYHMINRGTGVFDQFISSGGAMGVLMSLDRDMNREALKRVFRQSLKDKTLNVVTNKRELAKFLSGYTPLKAGVNVLRKGAEMSELATRVGAFNRVLNKTGNVEEAAYSARDLMDFNRAGIAVRQANKLIAFMNANIQGIDRMARAFKDNPASFMVRAFSSLVLPATLEYYWNQNLPPDMKAKYDNIPQWEKDSFFVLGIPGTGQFIRIPKPFEAGMLFATGTERMLDWFKTHDPNSFKEYGRNMLGALSPPLMITALTPILEAVTNHSFFRNAPIVPQSEQRLQRKDQYGLYTSETAKTIGNLLSKTPFADSNMASPRIIDNTIQGYTAGLGNYAVQGLDSLIRGLSGKQQVPLPAKQATEQPFLKSFFVNTAGGGQVRQDFYDKWNQLSQAKASADKNQQPYLDPEYARMKAADSVITSLSKAYKQIQASKTMDSATKRAKLDQLDAQMNMIAAKGLGR